MMMIRNQKSLCIISTRSYVEQTPMCRQINKTLS